MISMSLPSEYSYHNSASPTPYSTCLHQCRLLRILSPKESVASFELTTKNITSGYSEDDAEHAMYFLTYVSFGNIASEEQYY